MPILTLLSAHFHNEIGLRLWWRNFYTSHLVTLQANFKIFSFCIPMRHNCHKIHLADEFIAGLPSFAAEFKTSPLPPVEDKVDGLMMGCIPASFAARTNSAAPCRLLVSVRATAGRPWGLCCMSRHLKVTDASKFIIHSIIRGFTSILGLIQIPIAAISKLTRARL